MSTTMQERETAKWEAGAPVKGVLVNDAVSYDTRSHETDPATDKALQAAEDRHQLPNPDKEIEDVLAGLVTPRSKPVKEPPTAIEIPAHERQTPASAGASYETKENPEGLRAAIDRGAILSEPAKAPSKMERLLEASRERRYQREQKAAVGILFDDAGTKRPERFERREEAQNAAKTRNRERDPDRW